MHQTRWRSLDIPIHLHSLIAAGSPLPLLCCAELGCLARVSGQARHRQQRHARAKLAAHCRILQPRTRVTIHRAWLWRVELAGCRLAIVD